MWGGGGMELLFFIDFFHVSEYSKHFSTIHLYIFKILFLIIFRRMGGGGTLESKDHGLMHKIYLIADDIKYNRIAVVIVDIVS